MGRFQCIGLLLLAARAVASPMEAFEKREFQSAGGEKLRYLLHTPPANNAAKYPMVIWLHDILGVGRGNHRQIAGTNTAGGTLWAEASIQDRYPSFVVAPQCPLGSLWVNALNRQPNTKLQVLPELIESLKREYPVDPDRIYLVGQSMGAFAVWTMLETRPDLFAAAVAVAGGGRTDGAGAIASIPVWVFHGRRDLLVPVRESRKMVEALKEAGGDPRYTEYPTLGHTRKFWRTVFGDPELPAWLFAQKRHR